MWAGILVLFAVGLLSEGAVITGSQRLQFDVYAATKRVSLLGEELARECPDLYSSDDLLTKRELLSDADLTLKLQVENELINHLLDMLVRCRNGGSVVNSTTIPPSAPQQCHSNYTLNLSDAWRNNFTGSDLREDDINILTPGTTWFRFTGAAGTRLRDNCPTAYSCGSSGAYWSPDKMPSTIGETITIRLFESYRSKGRPVDDSDCRDNFSMEALATRCSAKGDFVYQLKKAFNGEDDTVCGMD